MKVLTTLVTVCILLGGLGTIILFGIIIFNSFEATSINAMLLRYGKVSAIILLMGLFLGAVRAIVLLIQKNSKQ